MPDRSAADLDETCHKLFPGYVPSPLNTSGPPSSEVLPPTRLPAIPATSHLAVRPDYAAPSGTANPNADQPGQTANRATESRLGLNSESAGRCYLDIPSERMPEPILRRRQEDLRRSAPGSDGRVHPASSWPGSGSVEDSPKGTQNSTVAPEPGLLSIRHHPPASSARSRMSASPR